MPAFLLPFGVGRPEAVHASAAAAPGRRFAGSVAVALVHCQPVQQWLVLQWPDGWPLLEHGPECQPHVQPLPRKSACALQQKLRLLAELSQSDVVQPELVQSALATGALPGVHVATSVAVPPVAGGDAEKGPFGQPGAEDLAATAVHAHAEARVRGLALDPAELAGSAWLSAPGLLHAALQAVVGLEAAGSTRSLLAARDFAELAAVDVGAAGSARSRLVARDCAELAAADLAATRSTMSRLVAQDFAEQAAPPGSGGYQAGRHQKPVAAALFHCPGPPLLRCRPGLPDETAVGRGQEHWPVLQPTRLYHPADLAPSPPEGCRTLSASGPQTF